MIGVKEGGAGVGKRGSVEDYLSKWVRSIENSERTEWNRTIHKRRRRRRVAGGDEHCPPGLRTVVARGIKSPPPLQTSLTVSPGWSSTGRGLAGLLLTMTHLRRGKGEIAQARFPRKYLHGSRRV